MNVETNLWMLFVYKTMINKIFFMRYVTFFVTHAHAQRMYLKPVLHHFSPLRADARNVRSFVGGERLFRIKLMLQHGEVGFRGIAA